MVGSYVEEQGDLQVVGYENGENEYWFTIVYMH